MRKNDPHCWLFVSDRPYQAIIYSFRPFFTQTIYTFPLCAGSRNGLTVNNFFYFQLFIHVILKKSVWKINRPFYDACPGHIHFIHYIIKKHWKKV